MDGLYKEFGLLLRRSRKEAKLTQLEVAERVGLTRTSITNIEKGRQHIPLHQLFLLASAVGVQPSELLPQRRAALADLLPERALATLKTDEEGMEFAERVMAKAGAPRSPKHRKAAA